MSLRPATDHDWPLIEGWLRQPAVQRWWGNLDSAEAEVRLAMSLPSAMCRIVEASGHPVGYAHCFDATVWGPTLPQGMPPGTWDADIFIGQGAHRGHGVGERALGMLCNEVFGSTLVPAVSIFAPVRNEAAVRAYERAGFRWQSIWNDPVFGPCWMLLIERPPPRQRAQLKR